MSTSSEPADREPASPLENKSSESAVAVPSQNLLPGTGGIPILNRLNRDTLRKMKKNISALTTQTQQVPRPTVRWVLEEQTVGVLPVQDEPASELEHVPSRHRLEKFQRYFKQISAHEQLIKCAYCSYGGDSIHQGHLYITQNYFAFRSNVFGYVTKLIIPTASVLGVSREKTAKIIPNAIGVTTQGKKYVFAFLRFRKSVYRLMVDVWKRSGAGPAIAKVIEDEISLDGIEEDGADEESDGDASLCDSDNSSSKTTITDDVADTKGSERTRPVASETRSSETAARRKKSLQDAAVEKTASFSKDAGNVVQVPRATLVLKLSVCLVVLLSITSVYLLCCIGHVYFRRAELPPVEASVDEYQKILDRQTHMHEESASALQEFLSSYRARISKVKQSMDILSLLEEDGKETSKS